MAARGAGSVHPPAIHEAGIYRIRVAGRLRPEWADRLEGFSLEVRREADGGWRTDLTGTIADHAALMGILDGLAIHGARLLEVRCLGTAGVEPSTTGAKPGGTSRPGYGRKP